MSFQKLLHGAVNLYVLEIDNDIKSKLSTSLEDSKITMRIYNAVESTDGVGIYNSVYPYGYYVKGDVVQTTFLFDSVTTNTLNKSLSVIQADNQNLSLIAIKLYTQTVSSVKNINDGTYTDLYEYTEIKSDIIHNISDEQYLSLEENAGEIELKIYNNPRITIQGLSTQRAFSSDTTYKIAIILNKLFPAEPTTNIEEVFFVTTSSASKEAKYNTNSTDVYKKLKNIPNMMDFDFILDNPEYFNHSILPVAKNNSGGIIREQDKNSNDIILDLNVGKEIETLAIKQFLSEYQTFFSTIDDLTINASDEVRTQLKNLKRILLKNSNLANVTFKGNEKGMSTLVDIFCQSTGYHLIALEKSPHLKNFVYRITSSIPKDHWTSSIRDIVHPCSWRDEYVEVDIDNDNTNLFFEYGKKYLALSKPRVVSYLDVSNINYYHTITDAYDVAALGNYDYHNKNNFNVHKYYSTIDYTNPTLTTMLDDSDNFVVTDTVNYGATVKDKYITTEIEYKFTGIATHYTYNIKINDAIYQSVRSTRNTMKFYLPYSAENYTVEVVLENNTFTHTIPTISKTHYLIDLSANFDVTPELITFALDDFKKYTWFIYEPDLVTINNTIETRTNYFDPTGYAGKKLRLKVLYFDGTERILTTVSNIV